jgi:spore maturation protein CgeB
MLATKACLHLVDNAATGRELRERLGFGQILVQPWAVDPDVYTPQSGITEEFDVVVTCGKGNPQPSPEALWHLDSDTPDLNAVRRGMVGHLAPFVDQFAKQSPKHAEVRAFMMALLETQVASRHVPLLNRMEEVAARDFKLQQAFQILSAAPGAFVQAGRIVRNVEIFERAFLISWLSRRFNMLLVGDHDLGPWGVKAYQIPAVHSSHLPATLARARVALCPSRWQDDAGLGTRPFEIAASGMAGVIQRRSGLEKFFEPEQEFVYFDTPVEAAAGIRALLDQPERRKSMGTNARVRILKDHTWKHRAQAITPAIEAARQRLKA